MTPCTETPDRGRGGVTVAIVNWHAEDWLGDTLAALARQTRPPDAVLLVDNGSRGPLPTACFDTAPLRVLRMPGNLGFAAANNRALDVCETECEARRRNR
jgi:GT2 family glycosyltransferase